MSPDLAAHPTQLHISAEGFGARHGAEIRGGADRKDMDRSGLEVVACPPERLSEMFRLRATVWIHEGADPAAFPDGEWREPRDASRLHWIAIDQDRVVATASLSLHSRLADVEEGHVYLEASLSSSGPVAAPARLTIAPARPRRHCDPCSNVAVGWHMARGLSTRAFPYSSP
jgi:hypothetical protein